MRNFHPDVGVLWRSRNDEPEQEVFCRLPEWMRPQNEDRDALIDLERLVPAILEGLGPKERKVLWYRFWGDYTLEETGKVLDVTKERIRQIEARALRKLKHPSRSELLLPFLDQCPKQARITIKDRIVLAEHKLKIAEEMAQKYEDVLNALDQKEKRRAIRAALDAEYQNWLKNN
jgi:hypothetical protein